MKERSPSSHVPRLSDVGAAIVNFTGNEGRGVLATGLGWTALGVDLVRDTPDDVGSVLRLLLIIMGVGAAVAGEAWM